MTPAECNDKILSPALALLPIKMDSPKARLMLLAIGLQESALVHRYQVLDDPTKKGPARGLWQFEQGGGVKGVLGHEKTTGWAHIVCAARDVPFNRLSVWLRLEKDDILAAVFARLLLYSDPKALPEPEDADGAFALYIRTWRPGAWDRGTPSQRASLRAKFDSHHDRARAALGL